VQHPFVGISRVPPVSIITLFLIVHPLGNEQRSWGLLECVMSGREFETDLLSAFALTIGSALGVGLPLTILIIWVCS
jgi:hypothetical protein